jgi:hypothetical protein
LAVLLALTVMLIVFDAWTVLVPTAGVEVLILYSYVSSDRGGKATGYLQTRPLSWWIVTWFIVVALILTLVGTFFRGPGWSWVWPWSFHA